jgi:hypothetical protein
VKNQVTRYSLLTIILLVLLLPVGMPIQADPLLQDSTACKTLNQDGVTL